MFDETHEFFCCFVLLNNQRVTENYSFVFACFLLVGHGKAKKKDFLQLSGELRSEDKKVPRAPLVFNKCYTRVFPTQFDSFFPESYNRDTCSTHFVQASPNFQFNISRLNEQNYSQIKSPLAEIICTSTEFHLQFHYNHSSGKSRASILPQKQPISTIH